MADEAPRESVDGWAERWNGENQPGWKMEEKTQQHIKNMEWLKEQSTLPKEATCLVPLCGDSPIVRYLYDQGYTVTGVEFVDTAVQRLLGQFPELEFEKKELDGGNVVFTSKDGRVTAVQGDFYQYSAPDSIDFVYDRASFVAINVSCLSFLYI